MTDIVCEFAHFSGSPTPPLQLFCKIIDTFEPCLLHFSLLSASRELVFLVEKKQFVYNYNTIVQLPDRFVSKTYTFVSIAYTFLHVPVGYVVYHIQHFWFIVGFNSLIGETKVYIFQYVQCFEFVM